MGAAAAVLAVGAASVVGIGRLQIDTSAGSLVPAGDPAVAAWEEAQASFGGDPVVVLFEGRGGGDLLAPDTLGRLVDLEGDLAALPDAAVVYGPGTALNQIAIQINELIISITARRDGLRAQAEEAARAGGAGDDAARAAGEAAVAGYEARYGALVAAGLPAGVPSLRNPQFARSVFLDADGRSRPPLRWIVPDDATAAVYVRPREGLDQAATERLVQAVRDRARRAGIGTDVTVTGAPAVAAALGEEVRREVPRLGVVALVAVALAFAVTMRGAPGGWSRRFLPLALGLAATLLTLAAFGFAGVPLSLGMLAFLPVMLGVGTDFPVQAAHRASTRTLAATAIAAAAGFAALVVSPLPFVRHLGLALAVGVVLSAALALAARRGTVGSPVAQETGQERLLGATSPDVFSASADPVSRRLPGFRRRAAVLLPAVALAAAGWALLPSMPVEARPERLASGLPALADAERAERVLGASGEVAVRVRAGDAVHPEVLAWFREAEERLVARFGDRLRPVVSPARLLSWLGPDPTAAQIDAALAVLPRYLSGATIRADRREAVAAFGLRLGDLAEQADLLSAVEAALPAAPAGARVDVTGLPVVASRGYDLLASGRLAASLAGPALAGVALLGLLRRRGHAVAAVASALLAVGWGVLALRVLDVGLSPLTIGLGSLTAAVGAEFTVFALERSAAGVARPWVGVVAAAATSAAGFAALGLSRLEVLRQFGLVLAGSVALALLAARVLVGRAAPAAAVARPPVSTPAADGLPTALDAGSVAG